MPLGDAIVAGGWFQPDCITKLGAKAVLRGRLPHFTRPCRPARHGASGVPARGLTQGAFGAGRDARACNGDDTGRSLNALVYAPSHLPHCCGFRSIS